MFYLRRIFLRHYLLNELTEGGDLGAAPEPVAPVDTGAVVSDVSAPTSMLEAMSNAIEPALGADGQPRDPLGRFAAKAGEVPTTPPAQGAVLKAGEQPITPAAQPPAAPEDPLAMPEGLTPKAQERFQKLANSNKELTEWREQVEPQITYIQETFQQHGIQREQFQTFVDFAGALNRGDVATAQRIMQTEMQNLALLTGQPLTADPLASHQDLREAVDGFQMTEQHAIEMARSRTQQGLQQQQARSQQQAQQEQQNSERAVGQAQQQIEQFCRQQMASDLDYNAVELHLTQAIKDGLLQGIQPEHWAAKVQQQYQLIKKVAGGQRTVAPATQVMRPTGAASPAQAPNTMFDAMFGQR